MKCTMIAIGVTLAAALAGCSSGDSTGGTDSSEPAVPAITERSSSDDLLLPLDQFIPTPAELSQLQAAYRVRLRQCVADYGLEFNPLVETPPPATVGPNARRYGVTDLAEISVYGYRGMPGASVRKPEQPRIPAEVATVLGGRGPSTINGQKVLAGGCAAKAQAEVRGGQSGPDDALAQNLSAETFARSKADSRVRKAIAGWSACMKQQGFNYATPDNAIGDPRFSTGAAASKAEIATATADISCKQQVNLVGIWAAVETAYQNRSVSKNREALEAVRTHQADQIKKAARLAALPQ